MSEDQPRIAPVEPPFDPESEEMLREMMLPASMRDQPTYQAFAEHPPLAFVRTWVRHLPLSRAFQDVREFVHASSLIPPRERELVALRICALTDFRAEWSIRVDAYGTRVGIDEDVIQATVLAGAEDPVWSAEDAALIKLVDELHETSHVSDATWAALANRFSEAQLLELLFLVGWYTMICFFGNGARVRGEDWAPPYPESPHHHA